MNDYHLNILTGYLQKLLETNQQILAELKKLRPVTEEQIQEISGCRWCGYGEGHHRECPRYNREQSLTWGNM